MKINGKENLESEIHTDNNTQDIHPNITNQEKVRNIGNHFAKIMEALGLNLEDPSLKETPKRVAKRYVNEVFKGLNKSNFPKICFFLRIRVGIGI